MRKFLKVLFSQVTVVCFLLLLQLLAILASLLRISEYFLYFNIFLQAISIITVVIIINRHSNPSYKLAWVVPILMVPLFGGLFYLFTTGQMHTKRYFKRLSALEKEVNCKYPQDDGISAEISGNFSHRLPIVKYINNVSGRNAYRNSESCYFPQGEDMYESMLTELQKAKHYIFIEYFIIGEGVMWSSILDILKKKAAEGVDIRVMYDGMGSLTTLPKNYPKTLESYGIKCRIFSPFTPFLSALQNNRDHRKIMVIDGKVAYTGGANLADEYINIDFTAGHWKDMSVMVKGEAAFSFSRMFLILWNHISGEKEDVSLFEPEFEESAEYNGYVMPYCDMPEDNFQIGEAVYFDIINRAKKYIYITTPYLVLDHEMVVALTNAAHSGIDIKMICPRVTDHWYVRAVGYSYYKELLDAGIKLYEYSPGFIHGKTFCSDDEVAVVGSINLDYRSLYLHFECASWFLDCPIVDAVREDFEKTLEKCTVIKPEDCTPRNIFKRILNALLRLFAPLM